MTMLSLGRLFTPLVLFETLPPKSRMEGLNQVRFGIIIIERDYDYPHFNFGPQACVGGF